jgi:hypothetical protein
VSAALRIVLASTLAVASSARADSLGVVVEGPTGEGGPLRVRIESWAIDHQMKVVASPLSVDAARTLANCLVLDDRKCAAAVVDKRGKARNVVYARIEATTISVFWFRKRHPAVAQKLACAPCSDDLLASVLDKLGGKSEDATGKEPVPDEEPEGAETPEPAPPEPAETPAPRWTWFAMGGGAALVATGITLYVTSESPTGARPTYLNDRPIGTGLAVAGVAVAAVGAYVWLTHSDSAPTVAPTNGGAVVGWALLF